ncbi:MAG: HNH endonuclease [Chloroflexota bacterium]|nr:HNH endonuclease [Chloroflexota bacterium]
MTPSTITENLRTKVRVTADNRCGYCLARQEYVPWMLEIEHIIPKSKGGADDEGNLWLACHSCNLYKSDQTHGRDPLSDQRVRIFNPRQQQWKQHFRWSEDGAMIVGKTACGRATILALNLNNLVAVTVRRNWIAAGWHPPD